MTEAYNNFYLWRKQKASSCVCVFRCEFSAVLKFIYLIHLRFQSNSIGSCAALRHTEIERIFVQLISFKLETGIHLSFSSPMKDSDPTFYIYSHVN